MIQLKISHVNPKMKIFYKTQEKIRGKMALDKEAIHMKKETRTVVYDDELRLEAYFYKLTKIYHKEGNMTPLTRYEQETIINFNAGEQIATVYTKDKAVMRKLDKLVADFSEVYRLMG